MAMIRTIGEAVLATEYRLGATKEHPQGYPLFTAENVLRGCGLANNASDATNDIDFAAGYCSDLTLNRVITCAAMTKRLDAAWAAGTGNGGLDTGAIANGTYHCWAIAKADGTQDWLFSASATAPTMPTGYSFKRRVGSIMRSAAAIVGFVQSGDRFWRKVPVLSVNVASSTGGTSAVTAVLTVPTGIIVLPVGTVTHIDNSPTVETFLLLTSLDQTDTAASVSVTSSSTPAGLATPQAEHNSMPLQVKTDTAASIRFRFSVSDADVVIRIWTHGWIDRRGRDD